MEAVIVTGVHRIQNGDQTADGIVHRRQEFTVLGGIDAAFQILTAAHIEVGFHAAAQKRLGEELIVSASDILRCGVGDVFLIRLPSHLVAVLRHECDELLTGSTVLHSFLNGTAQPFLPSRNTERIRLALGEGQAILPAKLVAVFLGLLHLPGALVKLLAVFKVYRVHDDVIVDVRRIHMRGLDEVVVAAAICFAELFLYRFEFILSCLSHAVDTGYETLHRFLTVCNIVQDTAQTA